MKEIIFEIIKFGFFISFKKEPYTEILTLDINDGVHGEVCLIDEDMPESHIVNLTRRQFEKLKLRAK